MIENKNSPNYKNHLFICTRCSHSEHCDNPDYATELRSLVKAACKSEFNKKELRVNASGCLGVCDEGVHAVVYPSGKWFKKLCKESINDIISYVKSTS